MIFTGDYFLLYAHNIAVAGAERSAVYNFKQGQIQFIPNSMYYILGELREKPVDTVKASLSAEDVAVFEEYLVWMRSQQMGFYTNDPELFPAMPLDFFLPEHLSVCVLEVNFLKDYRQLFSELDYLLCKHLEIRIRKEHYSLEKLTKLLTQLEGNVIKSVAIVLEYNDAIEQQQLAGLHKQFAKIDYFMIYGTPAGFAAQQDFIMCDKRTGNHFLRAPFPSDKYVISRRFFLHAYNFHPYFYKRAEIDANGLLKNCLIHQSDYGNVWDTPLRNLINNHLFTQWWNIDAGKIKNFDGDELKYARFFCDELEATDDGYYRLVKSN